MNVRQDKAPLFARILNSQLKGVLENILHSGIKLLLILNKLIFISISYENPFFLPLNTAYRF